MNNIKTTYQLEKERNINISKRQQLEYKIGEYACTNIKTVNGKILGINDAVPEFDLSHVELNGVVET